MRKTLSVILMSSLLVTACGLRDSRVNPANWFGRSQSVPLAQGTDQSANSANPLLPRRGGLFDRSRRREAVYAGQPFEQVTNLTIEQVPGGAIIRATGLAARQGIYAVQLTPINEGEADVDGVLTYRLEGVRPERGTAIGDEPTREVIAARSVTDQQLRGVRSIRVEGLQNAQVARR